jgi:hypothetical protein
MVKETKKISATKHKEGNHRTVYLIIAFYGLACRYDHHAYLWFTLLVNHTYYTNHCRIYG